MKQDINTHKFFITKEEPCPYIIGQKERKIFTHLRGEEATTLNSILSQVGFRRSQGIIYRPSCQTCSACTSVRVLVNHFIEKPSFKRVLKKNRDLIAITVENSVTTEHYDLFSQYIAQRHAQGGMDDMSVLDFKMMIEDSSAETVIIEYRKRDVDSGISGKGGALIACALVDILKDGLSMVYSFFDPDEHSRSMGTYMVLNMIERSSKLGKPYLYLGYWIDGSRKMDYKKRFLPQERLLPSGWTTIV